VQSQALEAAGNVHVDEPPFHLFSERLRLRRVSIGVVLEGSGKVAFCPCLGTPIAVRFTSATVAPPNDLIVRQPVLEVFGVPLAWAPIFWLRSPGRVGLLPPEVAWRGADGLFAGAGVHVPWTDGDVAEGLDLRAGGYFEGGVDAQVTLRTANTDTHLRWDWLKGNGGLDAVAQGQVAGGGGALPYHETAGWDLDVLRGQRAVQSTTDVYVAAYPFDRGDGQAVWQTGGWLLASGVRAVSLRGSDLLANTAGGPVVTVRRSDAMGSVGSYDATVEGGAVGVSGMDTTSFARAEGTATVAGHLGAVVASASAHAYGDVADDGARSGLDGEAQARASVGLPMARAFDASDPSDPWVHATEPRVEGAAIAVHESGVLVVPAARGMQTADGAAWVAAGTWSNVFGRWGGSRGAGELDVTAGGVGDSQQTALALRGRLAVVSDWVGLRADVARVLASSSTSSEGGATLGQVRIGPGTGLHLAAHVAGRDGVDPVLARALVFAPLEPATGFLSFTGWTGGAGLAVPIGPRVTAKAGADADLTAKDLVAATGSLELHDPCGCVVVRLAASHRIGRDGVDAWVTVDVPR
jgi:hypothetical protein